MNEIEFKLSMPSRASWTKGWSGAERNYAITRQLTDKKAAELLGGREEASWSYSFGDGWVARVTARIVRAGDRRPKSDGFSGYDWMVNSIIDNGRIEARP